MNGIVIQGDVMLYPVGGVPDGAVPQNGTEHTLAYGERTGHHHDLSGATLAVLEGERYVEVVGDYGMLRHPDHGPVPVPAGTYRVIQQVEPDVLGGFRNVAD